MAIRVGPRGKRWLFIAHENPPAAMTVLDVTEPASPRVVAQVPAAHSDVRANSLALFGDVLLLAQQTRTPGGHPAGVAFYDVSDPATPRQISFFDTSGPASRGVHFVSCLDGSYAHLSTGAADFTPANERDDQIYMIVDVRDPSRPREVGRWWVPGQRAGDGESLRRHDGVLDAGFRPHHCLSYPEHPDRAYVGYIDAGIVVLDIADRARPRLVARLDYHPPLPGFTHTVVPLFERGLLVVTDEASGEHGDDGYDWPKRVWIVDGRMEDNLVIVSSAPVPDRFGALWKTGGRIGAHNVHENEPMPGSAHLINTVVATWFSAGLRVYDISDPFRPEEVAAFLPPTPAGQRGCRISDVFVEDRGIVHALDRARGGLYVLECAPSIRLS